MRDRTVTADELLDMRRMKDLPNLAAQTTKAAAAMAKFAANHAMGAKANEAAHDAASAALREADACLHALIRLETTLAEGGDVPRMTDELAAALAASANAVRVAGDALRKA